MEEDVPVPGFITDLKYLAANKNWEARSSGLHSLFVIIPRNRRMPRRWDTCATILGASGCLAEIPASDERVEVPNLLPTSES